MGDKAYDEARRLKLENDILREKRENARLKTEAVMLERMEVISQGLADFFAGKACIRQGHAKWFFDRMEN